MSFDFPLEFGAIKLLAAFCRIGGFVFAFPFFDSPHIPGGYKMFFVLALSIVLYPILNHHWSDATLFSDFGMTKLILLVFSELLLGAAVSFFVHGVMEIFMYAGTVMDMGIGFNATAEFDPASNENRTVLSSLLSNVFIVSFLLMDGHHEVIKIAACSFETLGPGAFVFNEDILDLLVGTVSSIFLVGVQVALPVMATMFMINIGMGILARIGEDFPVMMLSFGIHLGVGLIVVGAIIPTILELCRHYGRELLETLTFIVQGTQ